MKLSAPRNTIGKVRLVYIIAASHSGSTLLAMLMNAHPEVCTVGELKATSLGDVEQYRCSCRRKIRECPFWNRIAEKMAERQLDFKVWNSGTDIRTGASAYTLRLLKPLHRGRVFEALRDAALCLSPAWRRQLPKIQQANAALMGSVLEHTGQKVIVDSSKIGIRLKYLLRNPQLDVKIVRLIRDGRAVSLTYMDPARFADAQDISLRGGGLGGDRSSERLPMAQAAREWRRSNEEAQALLQRVETSRWMEVRYEDLCREPGAVLKGLFAFVGVDPAPVNLDFRSTDHHIIGNGMRLDGSSRIELDERWRSVLSSSEIGVFNHVAGELNNRLGYN